MSSKSKDVCNVCELRFENVEEYISCKGVCENRVHPKCSGLKKAELKLIQEESQLLWFCNQCRIVGTNVSSLIWSLKAAVINCQDQIIMQNATIMAQTDLINSLKSELLDVKKLLVNEITRSNIKIPESTSSSSISNRTKSANKDTQIHYSQQLAKNLEQKKRDDGKKVPRAQQNSRNEEQKKMEERKEALDSEISTKRPISFEENDKLNNREWKEVSSKHNTKANRNKAIPKYGTGKNAPFSNKISGAIRRKWIYVGHLAGKDVSVEDIKEYLQHKENQDKFIIKKLETKGSNSAFSIGVPFDSYETIFNVDCWPDSVCLRDFNVRASFLDKRNHESRMN